MGLCKDIILEYLDYFKATFARCMFLMHALVIIWRTVVLMGDAFWALALGIVAICVEYIVTLIKRNGKEWDLLSPATFCYLLSVVPALWLQKLHNLGHFKGADGNGIAAVPSTSVELDFSASDWMQLSEQTMLVTIIISRWLLPKGRMTHNEVSQLLLLYLGLSSDIIDFISVFGFTQVSSSEAYTYVLLFFWTWALMQFTLVLNAKNEDENDKKNNDDDEDEDEDDDRKTNFDGEDAEAGKPHTSQDTPNFESSDTKELESGGGVGGGALGGNSNGFAGGAMDEEGGRVTVVEDDEDDDEEEGEDGKKQPKTLTLRDVMCKGELWSILVVVLLQDGPFLINRLVVMLHFKVFNYTIIFFICKNMLVLSLQFYRMIALCSESRAMVKESKMKAEMAMKTRRYSTISLRSLDSFHHMDEMKTIDEEDEDDLEKPWTGGPSRGHTGRRRTPEGSMADLTEDQSDRKSSLLNGPSTVSADGRFSSMKGVGKEFESSATVFMHDTRNVIHGTAPAGHYVSGITSPFSRTGTAAGTPAPSVFSPEVPATPVSMIGHKKLVLPLFPPQHDEPGSLTESSKPTWKTSKRDRNPSGASAGTMETNERLGRKESDTNIGERGKEGQNSDDSQSAFPFKPSRFQQVGRRIISKHARAKVAAVMAFDHKRSEPIIIGYNKVGSGSPPSRLRKSTPEGNTSGPYQSRWALPDSRSNIPRRPAPRKTVRPLVAATERDFSQTWALRVKATKKHKPQPLSLRAKSVDNMAAMTSPKRHSTPGAVAPARDSVSSVTSRDDVGKEPTSPAFPQSARSATRNSLPTLTSRGSYENMEF